MIDLTLLRHYRRFLAAGYRAAEALRNARILIEWNDYCDDSADDSKIGDPDTGSVRLRALPEEESYFDVYGKPDGYIDIYGRRVTAEEERERIEELIERDGCWCVVVEYLDPHTLQWEHAGSVGLCVGYDDVLSPYCNMYIPDLMREALDAMHDAWDQYDQDVAVTNEIASLA
jgi:hypothetical protein